MKRDWEKSVVKGNLIIYIFPVCIKLIKEINRLKIEHCQDVKHTLLVYLLSEVINYIVKI
jgi:hypothetical protein